MPLGISKIMVGIDGSKEFLNCQEMAEDEVKKWFDDIKEKADKSGTGFRSEIIMAKRSAVGTMLDYAEEQKIDLIAAGTRGRSGIRKCCLEVSLQA